MQSAKLLSIINSQTCLEENYNLFSSVLNIYNPHSEYTYLAGGALRRLITGEKLDSDWDFFFKTKNAADVFTFHLFSQPKLYTIISNERRPMNTTIQFVLNSTNQEFKFQLIDFRYYENVSEVLDSFDFTLCMFGIEKDNLFYADTAMTDIRDKKLVPNKITYPISSTRRILKYAKDGYRLDTDGIKSFLCGISFSELYSEYDKEKGIVRNSGMSGG